MTTTTPITSYHVVPVVAGRPTYALLDNVVVVDDVTWLHVRDANGIATYLEVNDDFHRTYDVVRRVSAPKLDGRAQSVKVTFTNHDYVTPSGRFARHEVELWITEPIDGDADLTELAWEAAEVWPESGWGTERGDSWWGSSVTLPNGRTVDFHGNEVR